jgi:hypothetical protein
VDHAVDAPSEAEIGRRHEVFGIVTGAATLLLLLSLWSYDMQGGENWIGPVGAGLAAVIAAAFGVGAWLLPVELGLLSFRLFTRQASVLGIARAVSTLVIVLVGCALLHLSLRDVVVFGGHLAGGVLGEVCGEVLRSLLGLAGAYVVGLAVLLVTLVLRTSISIVAVARWLGLGTQRAGTSLWSALRAIWEAWREARELERAEQEAREAALQPRIVSEAPLPSGSTLPGTVAAPRAASKNGTSKPKSSFDTGIYREDEDDVDVSDRGAARLDADDTLDDAPDEASEDADDDAPDSEERPPSTRSRRTTQRPWPRPRRRSRRAARPP